MDYVKIQICQMSTVADWPNEYQYIVLILFNAFWILELNDLYFCNRTILIRNLLIDISVFCLFQPI